VLAICETMSRHIVAPTPQDTFIGTAPLAFTFGLGGLLVFPLYAGASAVLYPAWQPDTLVEAINSPPGIGVPDGAHLFPAHVAA
jgi:2-aminobenzoate-CoA ligase